MFVNLYSLISLVNRITQFLLSQFRKIYHFRPDLDTLYKHVQHNHFRCPIKGSCYPYLKNSNTSAKTNQVIKSVFPSKIELKDKALEQEYYFIHDYDST